MRIVIRNNGIHCEDCTVGAHLVFAEAARIALERVDEDGNPLRRDRRLAGAISSCTLAAIDSLRAEVLSAEIVDEVTVVVR
jgi:hypothetical protein